MSEKIETNGFVAGETGEVASEALRQLMDHVSGDEDAPDGLLELLKKLSEDPDFAQLAQDHDIESKRKEKLALHYTEQIHAFFASKQWHYTPMDPMGKAMLLGFKMRNSTVRLQIIVEAEVECIRFNITLLNCQEEYRLAMSEYLAILNQPLRYGAFHLNDDGEVTYRYSVSYSGLPFSEEAFEGYIDACTIAADRYSKEIGKIAYGRFNDSEKKEWFNKIKQFAVALSR